MKRAALAVFLVIYALLASPAFSQHILSFTSLGDPFTKGSYITSTVNPTTNKIYVSDVASPSEIIVIDGTTRTISSTIALGLQGAQIVVNSRTNTVYAFTGDQNIYVIDGLTDQVVNALPLPTSDNCIVSIAVDRSANKIIAIDPCTKSGYVLDASGILVKTVSLPLGPFANYTQAEVNPTNHRLYVTDASDHEFAVVDLSAGTTTTVSVPNKWPDTVAVDTSLNLLYMADATLNLVEVFNGATNALIHTFQPPSGPSFVAVNQTTHVISVSGYQTIYFYNASSLTLDGQVTFPNAKEPFLEFAVNSTRNLLYVGVLPRNALAFVAGPKS